MAQELNILLYILTVLIPIHGALWLGRRQERIRTKKLVLQYWKLRK